MRCISSILKMSYNYTYDVDQQLGCGVRTGATLGSGERECDLYFLSYAFMLQKNSSYTVGEHRRKLAKRCLNHKIF